MKQLKKKLGMKVVKDRKVQKDRELISVFTLAWQLRIGDVNAMAVVHNRSVWHPGNSCRSLFETIFAARSVGNYPIWSWVGAIAIALLIHSHYKFLTNIASSAVFWSYNLALEQLAKQ